MYRSCNLNSFTRRSCVGTQISLYTHPHKSLRHVQVYQGSLYVCTSAVGMPLTSQLKPSRFFDLTQDSFCFRNENDFARSKTADFRSGIFRFRSRIRVGLSPFLATMSLAGYLRVRLIFPCLFVSSPTAFPVWFWFASVYLEATTGFTADQLTVNTSWTKTTCATLIWFTSYLFLLPFSFVFFLRYIFDKPPASCCITHERKEEMRRKENRGEERRTKERKGEERRGKECPIEAKY